MAKITLTIDEKQIETETGKTLLEVCRENNIDIPTMCHLDGLTDVGACRLCVVEIVGTPKLLPTCTTKV
ncbi:MAG: (2Fe-2S)-binding protein, partial [Candidatus Omnitrophica bacterium]|nr:(2Fe-2S)-binding protein [Candidatus Omnitrophota bacterium]